MKTSISRLAVLSIIFTFQGAIAADELETNCARAVVGILAEKQVLSKGGLCLGSLDALPKFNIDLGAAAFDSGKSDGFSVDAKTSKSLEDIKEIFFSDKNTSVSFIGYADGEKNRLEKYDGDFLGVGGTHFTLADLSSRIDDQNTLTAIKKQLEKRSGSIEYAQLPDETKSLIRNFFLAKERATKVCETALGGSGCGEDAIRGFASPALEKLNNMKCDNRRRAFMSIDLKPSGMKPTKNGLGKFSPLFKTPEPHKFQRDMQIASSLDLLSKLMSHNGGTAYLDEKVFYEDIKLVIPKECRAPGNDVDKSKMAANVVANAQRLLVNLNENLKDVQDASFVKAVKSGDYKEIKKSLTIIQETPLLKQTPSDKAKLKVISTLTAGFDKEGSGGKFDKTSNRYVEDPNESKKESATDIFNCFSSAKAIEENITAGVDGGDILVEASLYSDSDQNLDISLDSRSLYADEHGEKGWFCKKCNNGVRLDRLKDGTQKFKYFPRDKENALYAGIAVTGQENSKSLTMGSLKNLKVFNIHRGAFGEGKCSGSVCGCVKDAARDGKLEDVLAQSESVAMAGKELSGPGKNLFKQKVSFTNPDDNCIFTPPVPHTCQVDPQGNNEDNSNVVKSEAHSCKVLDKVVEKYKVDKNKSLQKYRTGAISGAECLEDQSIDEIKDCMESRHRRGSLGSGVSKE